MRFTFSQLWVGDFVGLMFSQFILLVDVGSHFESNSVQYKMDMMHDFVSRDPDFGVRVAKGNYWDTLGGILPAMTFCRVCSVQ